MKSAFTLEKKMQSQNMGAPPAGENENMMNDTRIPKPLWCFVLIDHRLPRLPRLLINLN